MSKASVDAFSAEVGRRLSIAVDFDGTLCPESWGEGGPRSPPHHTMRRALLAWRKAGHVIHVLTARDVNSLDDVHRYLKEHRLGWIPVGHSPHQYNVMSKLDLCWDVLIEDDDKILSLVADDCAPLCGTCGLEHQRLIVGVSAGGQLDP